MLPSAELRVRFRRRTRYPARPEPQPNTQSWQDEQLEQQIDFLQAVIRAIRDIRSQYTVSPKQRVQVRIKTVGAAPDILNKGLIHIPRSGRGRVG